MRRLFTATLLVSAGAIGYELLLMRVLSIVQWHHFAYMIISLALLGYGASGTFIALFKSRLESRFETAFAASALLFSITMVACFALGQRVPFNALEVVWDSRQFLNLSLIYLVFFVPFFFAATCIGLAFTCRRNDISRIYFFDLFGAGLGAVLLISALFAFVPQDTLLVLMTLPLIASVIMSTRSSARAPLVAVQLVWLALLVSGIPQNQLGLRVSEYKGLSQTLQVIDSRILDVSSSPLGLLTVVESPTVPIRHAPGLSFNTRHVPPEQLAVFTDADGMSAITRFDGDLNSVGYLGDMTAALPYALLDRPNVLVLGAGGGSDVLLGLYHGANSIEAVELNPQMTRLVSETYADFAGFVYDDPRVAVHTSEARGFVARSDMQYDLIHIGLLDSFGASGAGVHAQSESYIYTVEAIREYLEHTTPGGMLAITRWLKLPPRDGLKLVATAIDALRMMGVSEPGQQLAVIRSWNTSTMLIKHGVFTPREIETMQEFAESRSFDTAWFPGIQASDANRFNRLNEAYIYDGTKALLGPRADEFAERYKFYIQPASDNRPYYFHFFKWATLPEVVALRRVGGAGLIEWSYLILIATLLQAVIAGLVLILLPLSRVKRNWRAGTGPRMGAYFLLLGLAFLFIEMAFIQKFILFLSHPLYSVAVVLSGFLVFAGIGSAWSESLARVLEGRGRSPVAVAVGVIALLTIVYVVVLPLIFQRCIGFSDPVKVVMTIALIAPLAVSMGMPFPLGLQHVAATAPNFIPWAWGINGFASVVSAVLATLLAIEFGFVFVIMAALVLYAVAAMILSTSTGTTSPSPLHQ
ncbi:MAG: SAM-dependent methyltransferase [Gammaproteobacteria bacterium]|nr:SAM-dependent methyltransferase [Gammaproteobacteria bacterium]NNL50617.1 SAM-dependent methyltransferase [Woeseiaceae bacterium]